MIGTKAVGSGFWIGEKRFVTCLHVIGEAGRRFIIRTLDGETFRGVAVEYFSAEDDLAILLLDKPHSQWLPFAEQVTVGDPVCSVGNSEGGEVLKTDCGVIDSLGPRFLEVTAQIRPGCSGGPIVLESGEIVAMSSFLKFRAVAMRGNRFEYDNSLETSRKFGVRASVIKASIVAMDTTKPKTFEEVRAAYAEKALAPILLTIDRIVAMPIYKALTAQLNFEHRVRKTPVRTVTTTPSRHRGDYIPMGSSTPTTRSVGGNVIEDRIVLKSGNTEPLEGIGALCSAVQSFLDEATLDEHASPTTSAIFKNLRAIVDLLPQFADDYLSMQHRRGSEYLKLKDVEKLRQRLIPIQRAYTKQIAALRKAQTTPEDFED